MLTRNREISANVRQKRIFHKPWFLEHFLPTLLNPSVCSEKADIKVV